MLTSMATPLLAASRVEGWAGGGQSCTGRRERERERDESLGAMTNLKIGDVKVFVCGKTFWAWYRDSSIVLVVCLSMI